MQTLAGVQGRFSSRMICRSRFSPCNNCESDEHEGAQYGEPVTILRVKCAFFVEIGNPCRTGPKKVIVLAEPGTRFRADGRYATAVGGSPSGSGWTSEWIEGECAICATRILSHGVGSPEPVVLSKSQWTCARCPGDLVWNLHVPATGRMDFDACGRSLHWAMRFLPEHFFEWTARALHVTRGSWTHNWRNTSPAIRTSSALSGRSIFCLSQEPAGEG